MQKLVEKTISTIINAKGEWGVVLEDLDTGDLWEKNSKSIFYSASVIKLPIMATIFSEAEKGNVDLQSKVLLRKEDIVGGAGVMQHMTPGTYLTIYDIIVLMIIQSDNTATNILIDLVGVNAIAEFMQNIGMTNSTFSHKLMDKKADHKVRNVITPFDIATFL